MKQSYSARLVGQPGCGRRLPQPGQLTIGEELLGYHKTTTLGLTDDSREIGRSIGALNLAP